VLSTEIGWGCGLLGAELGLLKIPASFHDIDKIGVPDRVLLKPSPLDEAEWVLMKQHSEMGERILAATEIEGARQASVVIRHHHEDYDGGGYPDGLAGDQISLFSRIIGIADSYDAMVATRPYHCPKTHQEAMAILLDEAGGTHDPELMRIFCEIIQSSEFKVTST
jgi:HD-GYP domain-containing protein (c-di-GMP phosphodiesterase class II)